MFLGHPTLAVQPTDIAGELACEPFELRGPQTEAGHTYPAGTRVFPKEWDNAAPAVRVMIDGTTTEFDVPKSNLRPVGSTAPHVARYDVPLEAQADVVNARQKDLEDWIAQETHFRKKHTSWVAERDGRTNKLKDSQKSLNEMQIQQTMYNRFDASIEGIVDKANRDHRLSGSNALDPNIVKAMIFEETEMGTSGPFLPDVGPLGGGHEIANHYNLTQAIDSSGQMYARFLLKNDPGRTAHFHLEPILHDLAVKQRRKEVLEKKEHKSATEQTELQELRRLAGELDHPPNKNWEQFFYDYPGLQAAMLDLWGSASPALNKTYEHWIEMMVFELFVKRESVESWSEAVRAYNGNGPKARAYRDRVLERAKQAADAAKKGQPFAPLHPSK